MKKPLEQAVQAVENSMIGLIGSVLEDGKLVENYKNSKQDLNSVSYVYGGMSLMVFLLMSVFQVLYLKKEFTKKKVI